MKHKESNANTEGTKANQKVIDAAAKFKQWMSMWIESHRKAGDYANNNKALVDFLSKDGGFRLIKTYEEFCSLADEVKTLGYNTSNPPCDIDGFNVAHKTYEFLEAEASQIQSCFFSRNDATSEREEKNSDFQVGIFN